MAITSIILGVAAAASVGSEIYSSEKQSEAEQLQEQALKQQEGRAQAAASEQQIQRDNKLQMIQSQQRVAAVQSGMALTSGTFQSLSDEAYSNFAKATQIGNLNLEIQEDDINSKIAAARQNLSSEHWGDFFGAVGDVANIALMGTGKSPSGLGSENRPTQDLDKTWQQGTSGENWWEREQGSQLRDYWS